MSQDLIAYLDARFGETSQQIAAVQQQIASLREETLQRFEQIDQRFEAVETTARQTVVLVEGLRHEFHTVAEGFLGLIAPDFRNLDGRVKILEGWADRQHWDVVESVRRILHRPSQ